MGQPEIYDPHADGEELLDIALERSRQEGKRVLLSLGANWCGDSQKMHRLLHDDPGIARELSQHYVLVMVDVNEKGDAPRNAPLVTRLGQSLRRGIPMLLVLNSEGTLLNWDLEGRLLDSDHEHPEKVLRFLREWAGVSR